MSSFNPTTTLRLVLLLTALARAGFAANEHPIVPLWPNGAPGSEARKGEPEKIVGNNVSNIHHPSLTVHLPVKSQATGAAVIVAPGGGHARLSIQNEGYDVARWLADHGIAAFVLKYRLGKDDATPPGMPQPYAYDVHGLADTQRAIRLVRSRAAEWGVNPAAVGVIGFSAGGEVAALAAIRRISAGPTPPIPSIA